LVLVLNSMWLVGLEKALQNDRAMGTGATLVFSLGVAAFGFMVLVLVLRLQVWLQTCCNHDSFEKVWFLGQSSTKPSPSEADDGYASWHKETQYNFVRVFQPGQSVIMSEDYFGAAGECLMLIFVFCWVAMYFGEPKVLVVNASKERLGYNSLCVGLGTLPATCIAVPMFALMAYFNVKFVLVEMQCFEQDKTRMNSNTSVSSRLIYICFAISTAVYSLSFIVSSSTSVWWHSIPLVQYILCRYIVVWIKVSASSHPSGDQSHWIKLFIYGVVSLAFVSFLLANYAAYDHGHSGPLIPWQLTAFCDYCWFFCLPLTSKLMPKMDTSYAQMKPPANKVVIGQE